jgi:nucleolar MIF4G domain-containing protein 1
MIETLSNLKNNKVKKAIGGGASGTGAQETVERLKKFLSGMNKNRHGGWIFDSKIKFKAPYDLCIVRPHEPLRVTIEDLRSAEDRGKWWLVGAAWNGDPLTENKENPTRTVVVAEQENQLLKLARKQGMNTDIRRSIFVVLMSSEVNSGSGRVFRLFLISSAGLCGCLRKAWTVEPHGDSTTRNRPCPSPLLWECSSCFVPPSVLPVHTIYITQQEKAYNPYYALVCQELCRFSHSYKITLQFCLWDFLRELGESNVGGVELLKRQDELRLSSQGKHINRSRLKNMARTYSWWVAKDCCSLAIFKVSTLSPHIGHMPITHGRQPVSFTVLKDQTRDFLREFLLQLFIDTQISTPSVAANPQSLVQVVTSRNRDSVEEVFRKASVHEELRAGLHYFIRRTFREEVEEGGGFVAWAVEISTEALGGSL